MPKVSSSHVGNPAEEKPGLWSVAVSLTIRHDDGQSSNQEHKVYFDVSGHAVQAVYEAPALRAALDGCKSMEGYQDYVGYAYNILQDAVAPTGAPAYSWAYGLATQLIRRKVEADVAKPTL